MRVYAAYCVGQEHGRAVVKRLQKSKPAFDKFCHERLCNRMRKKEMEVEKRIEKTGRYTGDSWRKEKKNWFLMSIVLFSIACSECTRFGYPRIPH